MQTVRPLISQYNRTDQSSMFPSTTYESCTVKIGLIGGCHSFSSQNFNYFPDFSMKFPTFHTLFTNPKADNTLYFHSPICMTGKLGGTFKRKEFASSADEFFPLGLSSSPIKKISTFVQGLFSPERYFHLLEWNKAE